ncbi:MAG: DNA-binding protein [Bacteroidetes bacterium 4572_117]|nr:MAG: DNA-binding protein [Bacteroidetes bacterium 4572_117]
MNEFEKNEGYEREEIFSKAVRAGKRTYFFDVKATRKNDYYLTITERKRRYNDDGTFQVEKHKIFLYKEDFEKFSDGLTEVVDFINKTKGNQEILAVENSESNNFSKVDFEDLDK